MYVLLKGSVEVVINSFSDQVQSLGCMQEGSFFGEMSLLEGKPRTATIVADSEETVVLEISEVDMPDLLQNAPTVAYRLLLTLNNRLNAMLERIEQKDRKYVFRYKKDAKFKAAKTLTVKKNKTVSATAKKLKAKQKYYVRVRTYKTVKINGKSTKLYSGWSKTKTVKVK